MDILVKGTAVKFDDRPIEYLFAEIIAIPDFHAVRYTPTEKCFQIFWGFEREARLMPGRTLIILADGSHMLLSEKGVADYCVMESAESVAFAKRNQNMQ